MEAVERAPITELTGWSADVWVKKKNFIYHNLIQQIISYIAKNAQRRRKHCGSTNKQTHRQGRLQYTAQLSAQCKYMEGCRKARAIGAGQMNIQILTADSKRENNTHKNIEEKKQWMRLWLWVTTDLYSVLYISDRICSLLYMHCVFRDYYAPAPRAGGIKRWCASDICLSVCRVHRA